MCVRNPVPLLFSTCIDFCAGAREPHAAAIRVLCSKNRHHLTVLTTTLLLPAATGFHPLVYFPSPYSIMIPTKLYSILLSLSSSTTTLFWLRSLSFTHQLFYSSTTSVQIIYCSTLALV